MSTSVSFNGSTYSIPAAGEVAWAALSNFLIDVANNGQTKNSQIANVRVITTNDTLNANTDYAVACNHTGALAVTLPAGTTGKMFAVMDVSAAGASTYNITVAGTGGETINGAASWVLSRNKDCAIFQFVNSTHDWRVLSSFDIAAFFSDASTSQSGLVNITAQSFGGLKKLEGGGSIVGTVVATDANATLTNASSRNITYTGFTTSRDVTLPTTTISVSSFRPRRPFMSVFRICPLASTTCTVTELARMSALVSQQ